MVSMAKLKKADVEHVAKLAKLSLTPAEIKKFRSQLSEVISYVEQLREVDTTSTEPTSQTTGLENVYREDKIDLEDTLTPKEALSGSQKTHSNYFVTKAVLEESGKK
jgi:aspartyl-tRNA(Asn)/glutamyl-tRNA(Gln) amidotransferase subunit C